MAFLFYVLSSYSVLSGILAVNPSFSRINVWAFTLDSTALDKATMTTHCQSLPLEWATLVTLSFGQPTQTLPCQRIRHWNFQGQAWNCEHPIDHGFGGHTLKIGRVLW
ncbi:hypothetical protein PanWU01x14_087870 [Parasponia andersonii]|uniref:Uncharacterized protein n=1 Tax=Parasponia andersonii TaxID=3476 RepID=A0A2P5D7W7_PARAD|nr:hypothetical protein PanWU01x14_087870 [Parasponia andersonii]